MTDTGRAKAPRTEHVVSGCGGGVGRAGFDQLAATERGEGALNRALGQAGFIGDGAKARRDRFPVEADGPAIEMQVNQKGRRLLVVADQIAQEHVEHVVVEWDGDGQAGHGTDFVTIPLTGQGFLAGNPASR